MTDAKESAAKICIAVRSLGSHTPEKCPALPLLETALLEAEQKGLMNTPDPSCDEHVKLAVLAERERCCEVIMSKYVMKGSENDGMAFIPDLVEAIRQPTDGK